MRIELSAGLRNSIIVLEHFRDLQQYVDVPKASFVSIGCFTNCRECGYTFMCRAENGETFTFCIYEHRNSDVIIINGKEGFISMNGDLPYSSDSKYNYLGSFSYNQHYQCAEKLVELITNFFIKNKSEKVV